jgi:hypothetical protein
MPKSGPHIPIGRGAVLRRYQKKYKVGGITFDDSSLSLKGVTDKRVQTERALEKKLLLKGKRTAAKRRR